MELLAVMSPLLHAEPASEPPVETDLRALRSMDCQVFKKLQVAVAAPSFLKTLRDCLQRSMGKQQQHKQSFNPNSACEDLELTAREALEGGNLEFVHGQQADGSSMGRDDFVLIEKEDAVEALAYYIAVCISQSPEAQQMQPKQLQAALTTTLQGLRKSKFKQMCMWGHYVYRWSALTYSALQMWQNPWLVQAVLAALWTTSRIAVRRFL